MPSGCRRLRNYRLVGDRQLAGKWSERVSDNITAMASSADVIVRDRASRHASRTGGDDAGITGFGASKLATSLFPVEDAGFRPVWMEEARQRELRKAWSIIAGVGRTRTRDAVCTLHARNSWSARSGAVCRTSRFHRRVDPRTRGCGTGLFLALAPLGIAGPVELYRH